MTRGLRGGVRRPAARPAAAAVSRTCARPNRPFAAIVPAVASVLALALALTLAACGDASSPAIGAPSGSGGSAQVASTPTSSVTGPASTASPAASTPATGTASTSQPGVTEDPSLLAVLPADVGGTPVVLESQAFADATADPGFATNIADAAFGIAVSGDDLATAVVARPVPGVYTDGWFRDWRDTYDAGACAQSGGVAATAEAQIGGRTVFIATCAGGLRTYHTWLDEAGLVVSAFSLGEGRYGERLMAGIRP